MATDYKIVQDELAKQVTQLSRDLHMKGVRSLSRRHYRLGEKTLQRKRIKMLTKKIEDIKPTVSVIYNPNNAIKDHEIKGYLIYLLQLKDFFAREVKTKKEIIQQREEQIKRLCVKLCAMRNEYAKKKKALPTKGSEFMLLENISYRMNQLEKRICSLRHESKVIRDRIWDMRFFQRQYKQFEKEIRGKIEGVTDEAQQHLDAAVAAYEHRDELRNKKDIYRERCLQDWKKVAMNETALNIILEKTRKFEEFAELQDEVRTDTRIAVTGDLIEQGVTGLEPRLRDCRDLRAAIVSSSGRKTPEQMEDHFKLTEDQSYSMFRHLDELLGEMHYVQIKADELSAKNKALLRGMSTQERRLRWEIDENRSKARACTKEAEDAVAVRNKARSELDTLLERLQNLYVLCISQETGVDAGVKTPEAEREAGEDGGTETEQRKRKQDKEEGKGVGVESPPKIQHPGQKIDDANALDFGEVIEKRILEYLMLIEYLRIRALPIEETPPNIIGVDEDEPIIEELPAPHHLDTLQPRPLESKTSLGPIVDLEKKKDILQLDELKPTATEMVAEIESGGSEEEDAAASTRKGSK